MSTVTETHLKNDRRHRHIHFGGILYLIVCGWLVIIYFACERHTHPFVSFANLSEKFLDTKKSEILPPYQGKRYKIHCSIALWIGFADIINTKKIAFQQNFLATFAKETDCIFHLQIIYCTTKLLKRVLLSNNIWDILKFGGEGGHEFTVCW